MDKGSQKQTNVVNLGNLRSSIVKTREEIFKEKYFKEKNNELSI